MADTPNWDDLYDEPPDVEDKIASASDAAGVNPDDTLAIARFESGGTLSPNAQNPISAAHGVFQMMPATFHENAPDGADPNNVDDQISAGVAFTAKNKKALAEELGREPSRTELYSAHLFGLNGSKSFLSADDDTPVADVVGAQAAKANGLDGLTVGQTKQRLSAWMKDTPKELSWDDLSDTPPKQHALSWDDLSDAPPKKVAQDFSNVKSGASNVGPWDNVVYGGHIYNQQVNDAAREQYVATHGNDPTVPLPQLAGDTTFGTPVVQSAPRQQTLGEQVENFSRAAGGGAESALSQIPATLNLAEAGAESLDAKLAGRAPNADAYLQSAQENFAHSQAVGETAQQLSPTGAAVGTVAGMAPLLAIAPGAGVAEAAIPSIRAVLAAAAQRGLPAAASIATVQAADKAAAVLNQGASVDDAVKVYGAELAVRTGQNLMPVGAPSGFASAAARVGSRALSGAAIGAASQYGASHILHQELPQYEQEATPQDLETGAFLGSAMNAVHGGSTAETSAQRVQRLTDQIIAAHPEAADELAAGHDIAERVINETPKVEPNAIENGQEQADVPLQSEGRSESGQADQAGAGDRVQPETQGREEAVAEPVYARDTPDDNDLVAAWMAIASHDDAFKYPASESDSLPQIVRDVDPDYTVSASADKAQGNVEPADMAWEIHTPTGEAATVYQKGKRVWLDVSDHIPGQEGSKIYSMAANYAHNTGRVFEGDPAGLSDVAVKRRTENMLSSALKFRTTDHIQPHEKQLQGDAANGVAPLRWKAGDTEHNIGELLKTSYANTLREFPEIGDFRYNPKPNAFVKPDGTEITPREFDELADTKRREAYNGMARHFGLPQVEAGQRVAVADYQALPPGARASLRRTFTAGGRTLQRAVVTGSLLREQGAEVGRGILARYGARGTERAQGVADLGPLKGTLYSKNQTPAYDAGVSDSGPRFPEQTVDAVRQHLADTFTRGGVSRLERNGVELRSLADPQVAKDTANLTNEERRGVKGYTTPKGRVVILHDNVPLKDVPNTVVHEILHRNLGNILSAEKINSLASAVLRMAKNNPELQRSIASIPANTPKGDYAQEVLGHTIGNLFDQPVGRRFVDSLKLGLNRLGVPLTWLNAHEAALRDIGVQNLQHFAESDKPSYQVEGGRTTKPRVRVPVDQVPFTRLPDKAEAVQTESAKSGRPTQFGNEPTQNVEVFGVKNAAKAEQRAERGLDPVQVEGKRDFGTVWDKATQMRADDPGLGDRLAAEISANPRPLKPEETAVLAQHDAELNNQYDKALSDIEAAQKSGDKVAETNAQTRRAEIEQRLQIHDDASRKSGYEQGLGLAMRRAMANRDFSLARQMLRFKAIEGGDLPPMVRQRIEGYVKQIGDLNKALEEARAKQDQAVRARKARRGVPKSLKDEYADLQAKLAEIAGRTEPVVEFSQVREGETVYGNADPVQAGRQNSGVASPQGTDAGGRSAAAVSGQLDLFAPAGDRLAAVRRAAPELAQSARLVTTGAFRSGIQRITGWQDAAHIIAPLRKSPQEQALAVVADKNGRPLAVIRHTIGVSDASSIEPWSFTGAIAKVPDAAQVWLAHNHPSGVVEQSNADREITKNIQRLMSGSGIDVHGMIVVGPGKKTATFFDDKGEMGANQHPIPTAARTSEVPMQERALRRIQAGSGEPLRRPEDLSRIVKGYGDRSGVILLDNRHRTVGFLPLDEAQQAKLRTGDAATGTANVLRAVAEANSPAAVIVSRDVPSAQNLGRMLKDAGVRALDIAMVGDGGSVESAAYKGIDTSSPGPFFSRTDNVDAIVKAMARNRVAQGDYDAANPHALVDALHADVGGMTGLSRDQVRNMVAGVTRGPAPVKSELAARMDDLRKQLRASMRDPEAQRNATRMKQLKDQIADMQGHIDRLQSDPAATYDKPARVPPKYSDEVRAAEVERNRVRQKLQYLAEQRERAHMSLPARVGDFIHNLYMGSILSSLRVFPKLGWAVAGQHAADTLGDVVDAGVRHLPGISKYAQLSGRYGHGFDLGGLKEQYGNFGEAGKEALNQLRHGESSKDLLYGLKGDGEFHSFMGNLADAVGALEKARVITGFPGRTHAAVKEFVATPIFHKALYLRGQKLMQGKAAEYMKSGMPEERAQALAMQYASKPEVQAMLGAKAYADALESKMQGKNIYADSINRWIGGLERQGGAGRAAALAFRLMFPIRKVPMNIAAETTGYVAGALKAAFATRKDMSHMSPEQIEAHADYIMKNIRQQGVGAAGLILLGYLYPNLFPTPQIIGEKKHKDEGSLAEMMGASATGMFHGAPAMMVELGAGLNRLYDKAYANTHNAFTAFLQDLGENYGSQLARTVPYSNEAIHDYQTIKYAPYDNRNPASEIVGNKLRGFVPQAVQQGAQALDPYKGYRHPRSILEDIETGIPGLRETVPTTKPKPPKHARN